MNGLDCRKCNKQLRKIRGCEGRKELIEIEGIEIDRCPVKMIKPKSFIWMEAYNQYKSGFLPNQGGWLEQPIKFLEIIRVIDGAMEKFGDGKSI